MSDKTVKKSKADDQKKSPEMHNDVNFIGIVDDSAEYTIEDFASIMKPGEVSKYKAEPIKPKKT